MASIGKITQVIGSTFDAEFPEDDLPQIYNAIECTITRANGNRETLKLTARLDTGQEVEYFRHGGLLHYALRQRLTVPA